MLPTAPTAAASDGVASPKTMDPSTARIRTVSGKTPVTSLNHSSLRGISHSSLGGFGASLGSMTARTIT